MDVPNSTATQLNREAYKRSRGDKIGSDMISESIDKLFITDFSAVMYREEHGKKKTEERSNDQPTKVVLKVTKNRDGKTGKTHIYFDYPRSRFMTNDEFLEAFQETLTI